MAKLKTGAIRAFFRKTLKIFLYATVLWLLASVLLVTLLRFVRPPTSAFMLQRQLAATLGREAGFTLQQQWLPIDSISPQLPVAVVAAEDQKFPAHHGFDIEAIRSALDDAEDGERLRGASTISQQTAKNLFLWNGRSFVRKGMEAYFTVLIELIWPKRRIVEVYLNIAEFGDGIYGVATASRVYFHKSAGALNAHEAAILAAVLPNPKRLHADRPSAYVQRRAVWIERQVRQLGGPDYVAH